MESLLGPNLLPSSGSKPRPTSEVLKGGELVAIYVSASWCPPCRSFTPVLINFFKVAGKANGLRIVFVSSDRDVSSFNEYFKKMPWAALPYGAESAEIQQKLTSALQVKGIPSLIVMDATGKFVTDGARDEVMAAGNGAQMAEVVEAWKKREAVPIEEAKFGQGEQSFGVGSIVSFFLKNPLYIFGMLYFFNRIMEHLKKLGEEDEEKEL
mmetsp:Transcript_20193/g.58402  ORF Transcript_20193/g.58402 Transcript_20193/m.58402 type:complete len:210 (-) Transcript_20193:61-690(-)